MDPGSGVCCSKHGCAQLGKSSIDHGVLVGIDTASLLAVTSLAFFRR